MKTRGINFIIIMLFTIFYQTFSFAQKNSSTTNSIVTNQKLIDSLIFTIDNNYDILHSDYTPSVHKLSEMGIPAIEAIIPLLSSPKEDTRLHAQRVFEGVIYKMNGFISGQGFVDKGGETNARIVLTSIGYEWNEKDAAKRQIQINNLKKWVAENQKK